MQTKFHSLVLLLLLTSCVKPKENDKSTKSPSKTLVPESPNNSTRNLSPNEEDVGVEGKVVLDKTYNGIYCPDLRKASLIQNILTTDFIALRQTLEVSAEPLEKLICSFRGSIIVPTNHIFNIELFDNNARTFSILNKADSAELSIEMNHDLNADYFGQTFALHLVGPRNEASKDALILKPSNTEGKAGRKMTCSDVRKTDSKVTFHLKYHLYLYAGQQADAQNSELLEFQVSLMPPLRLKLQKCE